MILTPNWEYVADTVMGGVSTGTGTLHKIHGRTAMHLQGTVSLDNNGGFVQIAFDTVQNGKSLDASGFEGIELEVFGNDETYDLRLRTDQLERPWQSFRTDFTSLAQWTTLQIPFSQFVPHKTDAVFDARYLRRIGILAIGRVFEADIAVARVGLY